MTSVMKSLPVKTSFIDSIPNYDICVLHTQGKNNNYKKNIGVPVRAKFMQGNLRAPDFSNKIERGNKF